MVKREQKAQSTIKIAMVGKYCGLGDAYKSLREAVRHSIALGVQAELVLLMQNTVVKNSLSMLYKLCQVL